MKLTKSLILAGTALTSLLASHAAFAQTTATQTVEETKEIVVKGVRSVGPIRKETGPKTKAVIDQTTLSAATTGNTLIDSLNVVPGINFTNTDAYGSSGGNLRVRGLDGSRVSLTFDGIQLNDSGNYAIYTNQLPDSEIINTVSVQTGATDVDSMTASATGGTINFTTAKPLDDFTITAKAAYGEEVKTYGFIKIDSGKFGPFGTKAYFTYTGDSSDTWTTESFKGAKLQKEQYNAVIRQDFGDRGSFVQVAAHWNENRNVFMFSQTRATIYGTGAGRGWGYNSAGRANINPSNTGNIREQAKWVVNDKLTLTFDSAFQYTLANGGGNSTLSETDARLLGSSTATYVDINKNGVRDTASVPIYNPNTTNTHRASLATSAIYALNDFNTISIGASFDRARHRQTGEGTLLNPNGSAINVFGGKLDEALRIKTADGSFYRRRDRFSKADVDVFYINYRGTFLEEKLFVGLGLRSQKLERELNQNCYSPTTGTGSSSPYCTTQTAATTTATAEADVKVVTFGTSATKYFTPYKRTVDFSKTMPNVGATYKLTPVSQVYVNYAETMSAPRTDSYYAVVLDAATNKMSVANPSPETTETAEIGYRYQTPSFTATAAYFSATDHDRIVSSYDAVTDTFFDRNVGDIKRKGFEGGVAYKPVDVLTLNASVTYTDTELQSDLAFGKTTAGVTRYLPTKGKKLVETPTWMYTFGGKFDITEDLSLTLDGKFVGDRYSTDVNDDVATHYSVWNGSLRYNLPFLKSGTYVQLNGTNIFDKKYLSNISTSNNALTVVDNTGGTRTGSAPSFNMGAPQTFVLTLRTVF